MTEKKIIKEMSYLADSNFDNQLMKRFRGFGNYFFSLHLFPGSSGWGEPYTPGDIWFLQDWFQEVMNERGKIR